MTGPRRVGRAVWRAALGAGLALVVAALVPVGGAEVPGLEELDERTLAGLAPADGQPTRAGAERDLGWMDPHGLLEDYAVIDEAGLRWRLDRDAPWSLAPWQGPTAPVRPPLDGLRLLVDPGHYGGAWAEVEQRHRDLGHGEPVREGDLTWATARLLEEELAPRGVSIALSRGPPPAESFSGAAPGFRRESELGQALAERSGDGALAFVHRRSLFGRWLVDRQREALRAGDPFAMFARFDLRRRARRAESFAAEVTLSIHYNTLGPRGQRGLLAFVHGGLLPGELATRSQRYWAIRRLLEGSLAESAALAGELLAAASEELGVPLLAGEPVAVLPRKVAIAEHPGVFARNLGLLRRTPGVVVLFEGPPVDHPDEYALLQDRSVTVDGRGAPARARALAQALGRGLLRWRDGGSQ